MQTATLQVTNTKTFLLMLSGSLKCQSKGLGDILHTNQKYQRQISSYLSPWEKNHPHKCVLLDRGPPG